jgi:hypothetical protein
MASAMTAEIKQALAALDDATLTAEGFSKSVLKQLAAMTIPDSRVAALQHELATFTQHARSLRANDDFHSLRIRAHDLLKAAELLARPLPPVMPDAEIRRVWDQLQSVGWASATIELLPARMSAGERIQSFDYTKLTTDRQIINRQQLIDSSRPASWTRLDTWQAMHQRPEILSSREPVEATQARRGRYAGF